jgi:hypothetical protein
MSDLKDAEDVMNLDNSLRIKEINYPGFEPASLGEAP